MIKEATPPSKVPTNMLPRASGSGLPVYWDMAMHEAAMATPATAAVSSNRTTFTDGSELRFTARRNDYPFGAFRMPDVHCSFRLAALVEL